ncbi:MAG TPA: hypothetical protein PKY56_08825 [Candidatus Kapabacteria bacterium]|nr:hypothetical protein [Candidatus Kapabacteria bacterium]HPO63387.1 hypothetical protein [Candidatus Kapabacteria bacterium]
MDYTRIIIILCYFALGGFFSAISGALKYKNMKLFLKSKNKLSKKIYYFIGTIFIVYGLSHLFDFLHSTGNTIGLIIGYCLLIASVIYAYFNERKHNLIVENLEES